MKIQTKSAALFSPIALLSLSACGSVDEENSFSSAFNESFEEGWTTEFVDQCVSEAVKVGAPKADATKACTCVAGELVGKLDGITEKVNPPKEKMDAALKACGIPAS